METDHIVPREQGGDDEIENAIPVCFECHAEIHGYNDQHPRGRKFTPEELRKHKSQWLAICEENPQELIAPSRMADVGPLQALIDEMAFNQRIASRPESDNQGGEFHNQQFLRAIEQGSIAILRDEIKDCVLDAYAAMSAANSMIRAAWTHGKGTNLWSEGVNEATRRIIKVAPLIDAALKSLYEFLGSESLS